MGQVILEQRQGVNEIENWLDVFMSRGKCRGKIAVGTLQGSGESGYMQDQFYANGQVNWLKKNHIGKENTFITPNAFDSAGSLERTVANVVQIRAIGLDLDCYNVGLSYEEAEQKLRELIVAGEVPEPNLVIGSGNGLQCFFSIDGGAPANLSWLTRHIAATFVMKTTNLGSDPVCIGIERYFRMPFTFNVKEGKGKKPTSSNIWRTKEYDLSELYAYCEPIRHRAPASPIRRHKFKGIPKLGENGNKTLSLNVGRLNDFYKLIELREGDIELRNVMTYDFSFILSLITEEKDKVLLQAQRFNTYFNNPQPIKEVERTASNAFSDAREFWEQYKDNGYTMNGLTGNAEGIIKPKKTSTIIREQKITVEEMQHLDITINGDVKYERKIARRRAAGVKERSEYDKDRRSQKEKKLEQLRDILSSNPKMKQKDIAERMDVSSAYVGQLKKLL